MNNKAIDNKELEIAREFVHSTGCNIYLTGKAGTGKTTFLKDIRRKCAKRMVVTAPTGVAAINCNGVTLHSFFQLPFGPILPGADSGKRYRFSNQKISIIKSIDLLVIDEVSMVRADMLDGVDEVLRRYRRSSDPFGGIQLLLIGDLHQLPPVVKNSEASLLLRYYESPYFFHSKALGQTEFVTVELQHIYRQADQEFVGLLNRVRDNQVDGDTLKTLNSRLVKPEVIIEDDSTIMLCTHNSRADAINRRRLDALETPMTNFAATVEGDFPEQGYPTDAVLELKEGAQVMFIRNDASEDKRYFNGKIGTVIRLGEGVIHIRCPHDDEEIVVEPSTWENIEYRLNEETQEIEQHKTGEFVQLPVRLAWAITIHKSQGLTFDKAVIDAEAAFAHGQVYVALSRLRSFDGLLLGSPLRAQAVKTDPVIVQFTRQHLANPVTDEYLMQAKRAYQRRLLIECYDFRRLRRLLFRLFSLVSDNPVLVEAGGRFALLENTQQLETEIFVVAENFQRQLHSLFKEEVMPSQDSYIRERLEKAAGYFGQKIDVLFLQPLATFSPETDNKDLAKRLKKTMQELLEEITAKKAGILYCGSDFSPAGYLKAISSAELQVKVEKKRKEKVTTPTYSEEDVGHPVLYQALKVWRTAKSREENLTPFQVMHLKTLIQIAVNLPTSLHELEKVKGIGPKLLEKYGEELVKLVSDYAAGADMDVPVSKEGIPVSAELGDTYRLTLNMVQEGLDVEEIARKRGLAKSTIESHIVRLIKDGELALERMMPAEKIRLITEKAEQVGIEGLGRLKEALGEDISYGEIKMVLAQRQQQDSI